MTTPDDTSPPQPDDPRPQPPQPGAVWVEQHAPPDTEAEREALATVRSLSRLEEEN